MRRCGQGQAQVGAAPAARSWAPVGGGRRAADLQWQGSRRPSAGRQPPGVSGAPRARIGWHRAAAAPRVGPGCEKKHGKGVMNRHRRVVWRSRCLLPLSGTLSLYWANKFGPTPRARTKIYWYPKQFFGPCLGPCP
jgi:hypothetical protein